MGFVGLTGAELFRPHGENKFKYLEFELANLKVNKNIIMISFLKYLQDAKILFLYILIFWTSTNILVTYNIYNRLQIFTSKR